MIVDDMGAKEWMLTTTLVQTSLAGWLAGWLTDCPRVGHCMGWPAVLVYQQHPTS